MVARSPGGWGVGPVGGLKREVKRESSREPQRSIYDEPQRSTYNIQSPTDTRRPKQTNRSKQTPMASLSSVASIIDERLKSLVFKEKVPS